MDTFDQLIKLAMERRASDMHLCAGTAPTARIDGGLRPLTDYKCTPEDVYAVSMEILSEEQNDVLKSEGEVDFAYSLKGVGRFRINIFKQRGSYTLAARTITTEIPTCEQLGLPELFKELGYTSAMQTPRLTKIVLSMGIGEAIANKKLLDAAATDLGLITGQKAVKTKAKKSIANFKLREGQEVGVMVTLRGARMYEFLDRFVNVALPRVKDFRGINPNGFDGHGNYAMGAKEQLIFSEIEYDKIDKIRGMDIIIVTTANTDEEARELLRLLGMPFSK